MKTTPNTMQTPRKLLKSIALASAVLCLATSAQAAVVPVAVQNGSFEETTGQVSGGITFYRGVDYWDRNTDGVLDGNGFISGTANNLGGQPTSNTNPRYWTTTETEQDAVAYDARWPQFDDATNAGPTDGWQTVLFDKRGTTGANGNIKLGIGVVSSFGTGTSLTMKFDARFGTPTGGDAALDANTNFYAFFNVNGTRDTANQFASNMGAALGAGPADRKIQTWTELGRTNPGNLPAAPLVTASPVPAVGAGLASQADHMGHYSVTIPLAGLNPSDTLEIGFWYGKLTGVANATGSSTRVYLDNVTLELTIPTTISAGSGDWHTPATWNAPAVPLPVTPVEVGASASGHAVTITTATADSYSLLISSGSVTSTGQILNIHSKDIGGLSTAGGTLSLDATSTLNIAKANTSASFAGLTVAAGTTLNVTGELTVDSVKDLSGATINTPRVTLAGGTLTKTDGLAVGSGKSIGGNGTAASLVTLGSGGKVSPGTDTTIAALTASGLTLDAGSLLTMGATDTTTLDQITVSDSNGLTINGGAVTFLNGTGTAPQTALGAYNLIAYTGTIGGTGVSALTVANPVAGLRYAFSAGGGFVTLTISQGPLWSGPDAGVWSNAANWSGVTPASTDTLVYAAGGSGSSVNDIVAGSFKSIQFNSGVNAFTLSGNSVTLTGDPTANAVLNNSTNTQTINLPITVGANGAVNAVSGAVVFETLGTIDNNGNTLTVQGAQPVTLKAAMTGVGGLTMGSNGKLNLGADAAVSGTLTINASGTIDNTKGSTLTLTNSPLHVWNGDFTFNGTSDLHFGTGAVTGTKNGDQGVTVNGGAARTMTIGGAITMAGASSRLVKKGTGTMVISSAGSNLQRLQVTGGGTLLLDNSVAGAPSMAVVSERVRVNDNNTILDINNFALTTPAMDIDRGRIIVRGNSEITNTGGNRITGSGDSNAKSYRFMDTAVINGGTGNLETHWTQAAQSFYITIEDSAQASFNNVRFGPNAEYADASGHNTVLEVRDTAQLSTTLDMFVMERINDQNRNNAGGARVHIQVYQHGGTVSVGRDLRLCDNDPVKGANTVKHEVDGAYNLWSGSLLNVGGIITGGKTRTGVGQSYFNFHGGTLTYTGAVPQTDWINLTASAITDGIDSTKNLRVWEGATIDTGTQDLTVAQALLGPTGDGVSAIDTTGLTGTVYSNDCPPWVFITRDTAGGDTTGSGASAVPTLNAAGNITGFIITNPGNSYTVKPLIWLIRGDTGTTGTAVPAANITMAANSSYTGGLTKKGASKLTLTGANTYAGDTVVQNGTLSLSPTVAGGYLADGADVKLYTATAATLNLNTSAATDTIRSLYIDDVLQASGVWGAIGSGAPNTSALITGSGFLNVTIGASGYGTWATANVGGDLPHVDTNNDGVLNGVAYFMNQTGIITLPSVNGTNTVTWPNGGNIPSSNYGPGSGERYVVQTSSDLQTWNDVDTLDANLNKQAASVSYTITDPAPFFVRLRIIIP